MKRMKKIVSILLAAVMVLGMSVTVFAKDQVEDSGKGGSGSITIQGSDQKGESAGVAVAGKTFALYKVLDTEFANGVGPAEDGTGVVYKVPAELEAFYAGYFSLDASAAGFDAAVVEALGKLNDDSEELEEFAKAVLNEAKKSAALKMAEVAAGEDSTSLKVTGLPLGYYVIEDVFQSDNTGVDAVPVSALVLNTTTPDVTVKVKANAPEITKDIVETKVDPEKCSAEAHVHGAACYSGEELSCTKPQHVHVLACYSDEVNYVKYNDAAIGDTVTYRVASPIPNMAGYKHYFFVVNDTMAQGLKFDINSVMVTVDGVELAKDNMINGVASGYTVTETKNTDGTTAIEIVFQNFIQFKGADNVGKIIEITYDALVTEDVEVGPTGNLNEVGLKFPANHDEDSWWDPENPDKPKPEAPVGETPKQKVKTYVTGLKLLKTDETGKALVGAEFEIAGEALNKLLVTQEVFEEDANGTYYKLKDGTYTETAPTIAADETDNSHLYDSVTTKYSKGTTTKTVVKAESMMWTGTVDETGVLKIDGIKEGNYTITEVKAPNGYNILTAPIYITVGCEYPDSADGEGDCTWLVNTTANTDGTDVTPVIDNGVISLTVVNLSGALLPSTGGIGTTIFYVAGSILVLAAVVLLVTKKRMSHEK